MTAPRNSKDTNQPLWEAEMDVSKNKLTLSQRTDRFLLMSLYEQNSQVCQLRIDTFQDLGPKNEQPRLANDHPAVLKAFEVMKPIAEEYKQGKIKQGDTKALKLARDVAVKDMLQGSGSQKCNTIKAKPAANTCMAADATIAEPDAVVVQSGKVGHFKLVRQATQVDTPNKKQKKNTKQKEDTQQKGDAQKKEDTQHKGDTQQKTSEDVLVAVEEWLSQPEQDSPPARSTADLFYQAWSSFQADWK